MRSFNWHEEARQQWDGRAADWHRSSREMWDTGSRSTVVPFFQQYVSPGASVLDVGCGNGYGAYKVSQAGYRVVGVDLSESMIEMAGQWDGGDALSFQQGDLVQLPFTDEMFDAALAINSLEWTEQPLQALLEMKRVLKPGGRVCAAILGPTAMPRVNSYRRLYGEPVICNTMMPWEFTRLAAEQGFRIIGGAGVYKKGVPEQEITGLSTELKQALSFLWLSMLEKEHP